MSNQYHAKITHLWKLNYTVNTKILWNFLIILKKHVKIIDVYSLYLFFRKSKFLNNIYKARGLSLGVKTSSIHLFSNGCMFLWNVYEMSCKVFLLNVTTFQKCRSDIKSYSNSFYIIHLLYKSYFRPILYSPFFICKRFCTVLNSPKQSCV